MSKPNDSVQNNAHEKETIPKTALDFLVEILEDEERAYMSEHPVESDIRNRGVTDTVHPVENTGGGETTESDHPVENNCNFGGVTIYEEEPPVEMNVRNSIEKHEHLIENNCEWGGVTHNGNDHPVVVRVECSMNDHPVVVTVGDNKNEHTGWPDDQTDCGEEYWGE